MPPLLSFLGIAVMAVLTVTGTFFGGSGDVLDAVRGNAVRTSQINGTQVDLVAITWSTSTVDATWRNVGRVPIRNIAGWDVWARVNDSGGGYHPELLAYTDSANPSTDQWTLIGIYLDAAGSTSEAHQPGIIDPGEEFVLRMNVGATAADPGANAITLALPNGVTSAIWYTWETRSVAPDTVSYGGSLSADSGTFVYGVRGDLENDFWRYDPATDHWSDVEDATVPLDSGAALVSANDGGTPYIYGLTGDGRSDLLRFSINDNNWAAMADTPSAVGPGGALTWDGADTIWALKGSKPPGTSDVWRYSILGDTWSTVTETPSAVSLGGAVVYDSGSLYVFRGGNQSSFWCYDIASDTWVVLQGTPSGIHGGAALVAAEDAGTTYLYATRGKNTDTFWRYDLSLDTWSALAVAPAAIDDGGALAWDGSDAIFAYRGDDQSDFWGYSIASNQWTVRDQAPDVISAGGALAYGAGLVYAWRCRAGRSSCLRRGSRPIAVCLAR